MKGRFNTILLFSYILYNEGVWKRYEEYKKTPQKNKITTTTP